MCFKTRVAEARAAVNALSPADAHELTDTAGVIFLDPRPADAIARTTGLIPGALNVSLDDVAAGALPSALSDRSVHVITTCQAGPLGAIAAHELVKQGFHQVHYIDGGTQGWLDAGLPTER